MRKLSFVLLFLVLAAFAQAQSQNWNQVFGLTQTPTGFYNPLGPDATRNGHSDWLTRDSANGGSYTTPFYHLGQDMLVSTPTYIDGTPAGVGHQVFAISDGEIWYVSKDSSWGQTTCKKIKDITGYKPTECNSDTQLVNNVAVFVKHKVLNGSYIVGVYAHIIDYNLLTGQPFENKDSKDAHAAVHTLLTKGQPFAVLGNYPASVPHLHFGMYPNFPPAYPSGNKGRGYDLDANQYTLSNGSIVACSGCANPLTPTWPNKYGLDDPIQWLTTVYPDNWISNATTSAINQTAMPSSITIPLGGVGVVPWQVSSLQGFTGTIQGNVVVKPNLTGNNLKIKSLMTQPQVLGANQTTSLQSLMYVPSSMQVQAYAADIQTASLDGSGNSFVTPTSALTIQAVQPTSGGPAGELFSSSLYNDANLLAYYRFEGNSTDSKGGHNGTDSGVTYGTSYGKFGQGASFSNASTNTGSWNIPTVFSISGWVYLNSLTDLQTLFSNYSGGGTGSNVVQLFVSAGDGSVVYSNFVVDSTASTAKLTANAWHHVAVTHNGSTVKIYIDGALDHQATVAHASSTQTNFIGKRGDGYQPLNGKVDDLAIFSRELTAAEISSLYNGSGSGSMPVISSVGTSGGMAVPPVGSTDSFTVYVAAASVDPASVQAVIYGPSCSTGCAANTPYLDATTTSYVGTFPTPTQSGTYQLYLKNGATGTLSNSYNLTVNPTLSATCSPNTSSVATNTPVTFTAYPSGGLGPYSFNWDAAAFGTGNQTSVSFPNGGYWAGIDLFVTDSLGNQYHATCGVTVQLGQPTISAIVPLGTPTAGTAFTAGLSGTNFDSTPGTFQVSFCQDPGDTVCYQQPSGIIVANNGLNGTEAVVTGINLSAGKWVAKVRNGSTGSWSNFSSVFTVASAPAGPTELFSSSLFSDSNLLAYYRFEGNSTDSKNGHNGTDSGVVYGTSYGKFGQGASFSNGSINTGSWNIPTAFSISGWVYLNNLANLQTLFSNYNGATGSNTVQLFVSAGDGSVVYSNFVVDSASSTTKLTANAWHHVAVTHNGTAVKIYIDGVLDHQANVAHASSTQTNYIGKRPDGYQPLDGRTDDLSVFGRELTATEISNLYSGGGGSPTTGTVSVTVSGYSSSVSCTLNGASITAPVTLNNQNTGSYSLSCTPPTGYTISSITPSATQTLSGGGTVTFAVALSSSSSGPTELYLTSLFSDSTLISYYRFEGNSTDSKGGHNGTDSGVTYGTSYGKFGQGAAFSNGSINTGSWNIPTSFTVSGWVYLNNLANLQTLFSNYNGSTGSNTVQLFVSEGTGGVVYSNFLVDSGTSTAKLTANAWHHVAVTHNGSTVKIYIDGNLDHQATVAHSSSTQAGYIGKRPDGYQSLDGRADDLAIFGRELSAAEISNLYNGSGSASPSFTFTTLNGSKSVQAGNQVGFDLNLTPTNNFTNQVTVFVSGLPSSTSVVNSSLVFSIGPTSGASFTLTLQTTGGTPAGTYPLTLLAQGGGINQYLYPTLTVTAPPPGPLSASCYTSPNPVNLGNGTTLFGNATGGTGGYLYSLNGGSYQSSSSQVYLPADAGSYTYTVGVKDSSNATASTSCGLTVNGVAPSVSSYTWDAQPVHGVNFSGYVYGNVFTPSSTVWFYGPGCSNGCQHPGAGVSVQSLTTIRLTNVNLGAGSYQVQVRTAYGSATSTSFTVN